MADDIELLPIDFSGLPHFRSCYDGEALSLQTAATAPEWMQAASIRRAMQQHPAGFPVPTAHCSASHTHIPEVGVERIKLILHHAYTSSA